MKCNGRNLHVVLCALCTISTTLSCAPVVSRDRIEEPLVTTAASVAPAMTSRVDIIDRNWARVNVDVRIGNNANPEDNRSLGTRELTRGQTWSIPSDGEDVWYRRDADPDRPNGQWTNWIHRPVYPNVSEVYEEEI
jgi:hypothetical protein